ncbi:MAG: integrase arm-type DNA-binding domain-containing protein [Magnetococcales bacterium]|nr:integrase arm-type DNA-binding domain-containing protein [Magnetococcales bacterium]
MLTDAIIKKTKPGEQAIRLTDEDGLLLIVNPNGGRWWRFRYRWEGRQQMVSMGTYPEITLKMARDRRDDARRLLAQGINPSAHRQATKAATSGADSFEVVAREWFIKHSPGWAETHSSKIIQRLERDAFPWVGSKGIATLTAPELLVVLRRVEARGTVETAYRLSQNLGQIFRYGIATGRCERNPVADLRGALPPARGGHMAAITDPTQLAQLLRAIDGYGGFISVRSALKLLPMLLLRPGELRGGLWSEIDLDAAEWRIEGARMKMKEPHIVPLSRQAVEILRDLQPYSGDGDYVFPSARNRGQPFSNMGLAMALKSLGYSGDEQTAHGFRATARTLLDEVLGFRPELIEHQLAHAVKDALGRAYNRTTHLPERRKMMQAWADYLEGLKSGNVVQLRTVNA